MSEEYNIEDYDDIVDFLRHYARPYDNGKSAILIMEGDSLLEAADEIVRLRKDNENLRLLIATWANADEAGYQPCQQFNCNCGDPMCEAVDALREAIGR